MATSGWRAEGDAGLLHVGARYYDPQVGRFLTRDTYLEEHPYLYCEHDPVDATDPSGHRTEEWQQFLGGALGTLGGMVGYNLGGPGTPGGYLLGTLLGGIGAWIGYKIPEWYEWYRGKVEDYFSYDQGLPPFNPHELYIETQRLGLPPPKPRDLGRWIVPLY